MEEEEEEEVVFKGGVTASASQYPVYMIFFFWQGIRCVGEIMREFASTLLRNYEDFVSRYPAAHQVTLYFVFFVFFSYLLYYSVDVAAQL